jgi:hypothetical protein
MNECEYGVLMVDGKTEVPGEKLFPMAFCSLEISPE